MSRFSKSDDTTLAMAEQGGHNPGKHGKPGKLIEFEKLSKSQGKLRKSLIFPEKPGKLTENEKICDMIAKKTHCIKFFSLQLLREKF